MNHCWLGALFKHVSRWGCHRLCCDKSLWCPCQSSPSPSEALKASIERVLQAGSSSVALLGSEQRHFSNWFMASIDSAIAPRDLSRFANSGNMGSDGTSQKVVSQEVDSSFRRASSTSSGVDFWKLGLFDHWSHAKLLFCDNFFIILHSMIDLFFQIHLLTICLSFKDAFKR